MNKLREHNGVNIEEAMCLKELEGSSKATNFGIHLLSISICISECF